MNAILDVVKRLKSVDDAIKLLKTQVEFTPDIEKALDYAMKAHEGQKRKSGEPYIIHPILVAAITASISGDEVMVISALLHDVVEDTPVTIEEIGEEFGSDVQLIVEGLTKIVKIRDEKLLPSSSDKKLIASALTFRKMLIASIQDVRVLVIKLCDRLHNMLTLDSLPKKKQLRISEETLVVYAPVAHRLGISKIKNQLEDLCFMYIYPNEYKKIDEYIKSHNQSLHIKLNAFISKVKNMLGNHGFHRDDVEVSGRVKHYYSIYMKMQRKGISIDEVLDLLAVRIITKESIECYGILGVLHLNFTPLISRFKDYIALPKENGYRTIHTTLFDESGIVEAQIRTLTMHHLAEYGIAAHWKYKEDAKDGDINLEWLKSLVFKDDSAEEFLQQAKNDLFSEDVIVYSPKGERFTFPKGSVALDFAYAVHSEIGDRADTAFINKKRASLLTILKNGDIVRIETRKEPILHCSWYESVKTSRAKVGIKTRCNQRIREVNEMSGFNILATIFNTSSEEIKEILEKSGSLISIEKVPICLDTLKEKIYKVATDNQIKEVRPWELFKRGYKRPYLRRIDRFNFFANRPIDKVEFDYCCHPKAGDDIVALYEDSGVVVIHHKLCKKVYEQIKNNSPMVFVEWVNSKLMKYRLTVALQNRKGMLAKLLIALSDLKLNIIAIEMGIYRSDIAEYCRIDVESEKLNRKEIKEELSQKFKLIDIVSLDDAYNNK